MSLTQTRLTTGTAPQPRMVRIYVMGREYMVPEGLTIHKALEYAGFRLIRGAGCRGGFCGACATVYRKPGDYKLRITLACQSVVEDGMHLVILPYAPIPRVNYRLETLRPETGFLLKLFPEVTRCVACNTCTKACPQGLQVMDAVQAIKRGDLVRAADLSFDCIACGICSMRCPADIRHANLFQLVRRIYGKYLSPKPRHLEERIKEIEQGKYKEELERLKQASLEEVKKLYASRVIEPEE